MTDAVDPSAFITVIGILVGGIALLILATWYSARRR
jgi:hypothetical protein